MSEPTTSDEIVQAYRAARNWATEHRHPQPDDRMVDAVLAAVVPLLRKQWEAELSECDERVIPPRFLTTDPQGPPMPCARKPLGHPLPHRAADGMEWWPIGDAADV